MSQCNQTCVNTLGSFYCECHDGFTTHDEGRICEGRLCLKPRLWPFVSLNGDFIHGTLTCSMVLKYYALFQIIMNAKKSATKGTTVQKLLHAPMFQVHIIVHVMLVLKATR